MGYITEQDLLNYNLAVNAPMTKGMVLKNIITEDEASQEKENMLKGVNYYKVENDILNEDFRVYYDQFGIERTDKNAANNRLPHGFHRKMVIEKVAYLLKKKPTVSYTDPKTDKEVEENVGDVEDLLGNDFHDILQDWCTGASNKGREWLHVFLDGEAFDYAIVPAEQIIAIYETSRQKKLVSLIRYYTLTVNTAGKESKKYFAEWWYPDHVDYYEEAADGGAFTIVESNQPHFEIFNTAEPDKVENGSWGRVPFIQLKNNSDALSDLAPIKALVDGYDMGESLFQNDLDDLQEAGLFASGVSESPHDLRDNYRQSKVIVSPDADANLHPMTVEIPYEARNRGSETLAENIYSFGMGINPNNDSFGNDPSGVALKWETMPFDLKVGLLEIKLIRALNELMWFTSEFLNRTESKNIDPNGYGFAFNKTVIVNTTEQISNAIASNGFVSKTTALTMHPEVSNVEDELNRIKEDNKQLELIPLDDDDNE